MNHVPELVDLPDPASQPLVHPLDLPDARRPYAIATLIAELTGPLAVLVLGLAVWSIAHPPVIGLLVAAVVAGAGYAATRWYRREAWAYIPRKRQDKARALPAGWSVARVVVRAATTGTAVWLGARLLGESGASGAVKAATLGALAGLVVDVAVAYVWRLTWHLARRDPARPDIVGLAVAAGLAIGFLPAQRFLLGAESLFGPHASEVGAGFVCAIGLTAGLWAASAVSSTSQETEPCDG